VREIDRLTVESHLLEALQHLATAGVVVRHLERTAELSQEDRLRLTRSAAEVQAMLDKVAGMLSSRSIDLRIMELLRQSEDDERA